MGVAKTLSNYLLPLMLNPTMALCEIQLFNAPNSTDHYAQYDSMGAQFGDSIPDEGLFGIVQLADPVDACGHLNNTDIPEPSQEGNRTIYPILLIKRGDCEFHEKILTAQTHGYMGAIVYDDKDGPLIPMGSQSPSDIEISSVFTTKEAGEYFKSIITGKSALAEPKDLFVNITPDDMPPWPPTKFLLPFAMAVGSCLLIMLVSTVVKLVRDWRKSRRGRLSRRKLNQLPVIKFNREQHAQVFECCAICLEDFKNGDKIRELPCKHGYHKSCIDPWLTSNRKVCPLCKRTVLPSSDDSDVSESEDAPLLENEAGQNREDDEQTPRVVGWARSLANGLSNGSSNENRRQRTMSDRSYESITDLNPDDGISTGTTSTRHTTVTTITSEYDAAISDTTEIRRPVSPTSSNDGDDEGTPAPIPETTNEIL
jgi:E3 ubiquitin-protein ligase RNF13